MTIKAIELIAIHVGPKIGLGILIFIIAWITGAIVKHVIVHLADKLINRRYLYRMLGTAAKVAIMAAGLISALGTMGINVTALVAGLGVASFSLTFAMKDTVSNVIAGFMVLFYQPFTVGDEITVSSATGRVKDINLRYTVLENETDVAMIPNATVLSNVVLKKHSQI